MLNLLFEIVKNFPLRGIHLILLYVHKVYISIENRDGGN